MPESKKQREDADRGREQVEALLSRQRARAGARDESAGKPIGLLPVEGIRSLGRTVEAFRKKRRGS